MLLKYLASFNLLFWIIVISANTSHTAELKDTRVLEHMVLHYVNPCDELFRVNYTIEYAYSFALDYYKRLASSICYNQYKKYWIESINKINNCAKYAPKSRRPKRQILNTIGNIVGNAVTNFVTSQFQSNSVTTRSQRL